MKQCKSAKSYRAKRAPTCNGGKGCDACRAKWRKVVRANVSKPESMRLRRTSRPVLSAEFLSALARDGARVYRCALDSLTVQEIAEKLIGSCHNPELEDLVNRFDADQCAELDALAFNCTQCGWWCSADECNDSPATGEWICDDCNSEYATDD